jgi:hypothetical protein
MKSLSSTKCQIARWLARILAGVFFLLWGSFFIHHLSDWYLNTVDMPPLWVTALMALHFGLLVSLAMGWKWELAGGLLVLGCGIAFFGLMGAWKIWFLIGPTLLPGILWLVLGFKPPRAARQAQDEPLTESN